MSVSPYSYQFEGRDKRVSLRDMVRRQHNDLFRRAASPVVSVESYLHRVAPLTNARQRPASSQGTRFDPIVHSAATAMERAAYPRAMPDPDLPPRPHPKQLRVTLKEQLEGVLATMQEMKAAGNNVEKPEVELLQRALRLGREMTGQPLVTPRAAAVPTVDPPITDNLSQRMRLLFGKLRVISTAPQVYRDMVESKEAMETLYNFAMHCSMVTLDDPAAIRSIEERIRSAVGAATASIDVKAEGLPSAPTNRRSSRLSTSQGLQMLFPLVMEDRPLGSIVLTYDTQDHPLPSGKSLTHVSFLMDSITSVVALAVQNQQSFLESRFQQHKAEAMLVMARQLSEDNLNEDVLVQSIIVSAKKLIDADRCSVFVVHRDTLTAFFEGGAKVTIDINTGIAGHVAKTGDVICLADAYTDIRFNQEVDKKTGYRTRSLLCLPVYCEGNIVAVAQLINKHSKGSDPGIFDPRDVDVFQTFSAFIAVCLRNCRVYSQLLQEQRKGETILTVVRQLSRCDIRDVRNVVAQVMRGAKELLNADRSSLFLIDRESNELHTTVADSTGGREIRVSMGKGIVGSVALSGKGLNIPDAYADDRFNRDVDAQFGYVTKSILTEPIQFNDEVIAVAQLVNKLDRDGVPIAFSDDDEQTFITFALFAGISLSNARLLEFAINAGNEAVALQSTKTPVRRGSIKPADDIPSHVVNSIMETQLRREVTETIQQVSFNLFEIREVEIQPMDVATKVLAEVFLSTGLPQKFGCAPETLYRFIIACRRKYRNVPYHNFYHAVDACQTMHTFLYAGKAADLLTPLECFVLLATAVVHDLDHMGLNNSFHLKTDSPLGILSSASGNKSVLEVHHCNLAIEILDDPAKCIFGGLSPEDAVIAYKSLIDCVLATDMSRHKELMEQFDAMIVKGYDPQSAEDRLQAMQALMKAADISNVTKPFATSRLWGMMVTEEFFKQGEREKERGLSVLPMFDRSQNQELAKGQLGFIQFVAEPFFRRIVSKLFTGMQWCVDNISSNAVLWQKNLEERQRAASSLEGSLAR